MLKKLIFYFSKCVLHLYTDTQYRNIYNWRGSFQVNTQRVLSTIFVEIPYLKMIILYRILGV